MLFGVAEKNLEEPVIYYFKYCPGIFLEGLRKTMKTVRITSIPTEGEPKHAEYTCPINAP
jgi:hypothetical protein